MWVYGGYEFNSGILQDFYHLNLHGEEFVWTEVKPESNQSEWPGPLSRHTAIVYKENMYVFGGKCGTISNSSALFSWSFTDSKWEKISHGSGPGPLPSDSHNSVLYEKEGAAEMVVFGGYFGDLGKYSRSLFSFDLLRKKWRTIHHELKLKKDQKHLYPKKRANTGATILKNALYIFGGTDGKKKFNDLWKFDLGVEKWERIQCEGVLPEARIGHSMFTYNGIMLLFGGIHDIAHERNDLYGFKEDLDQWRCLEKDDLKKYEELEVLTPILKTGNNSSLPHSKSGLVLIEDVRERKYHNTDEDEDLASADRHLSNQTKNPFLSLLPKNAVFIRKPYKKSVDSTEEESSSWKKDIDTTKRERLKKEKLLKKMALLADLEIPVDQKEQFDISSPTTQALRSSIAALPNLTKKGFGAKKSEVYIKTEESTNEEEVNHISSSSTLKGKKPCARDGFSACVYEGRLIVFGGDRHHMPFNDLFALNLDKLVSKM